MLRIGDANGRSNEPPRLDARLARLAARQHGVVSLAQLGGLGLGKRGAAHRAARGCLHRVHPGVYAVGHPGLTPEGRRFAALLACGPGAALSHRSAAAMWEIRASDRSRIEATTPKRGRSAPSGVQLHFTRSLPGEDVTRIGGLRVTTVARTLVDLAGVLARSALGRAVHEAEYLRLLDIAALEAALARANGRRGTAALRPAMAEPSPGATRSALEERFLSVVRGRLPTPELNVMIDVPGQPIEVDGVWREARDPDHRQSGATRPRAWSV